MNKLEKYAQLVIGSGLNIQKDQILHINTTLESAPLVRIITRMAYEAGAKDVIVAWNDDEVTLTKYKLAPKETFKSIPKFIVDKFNTIDNDNGAYLSINSTDPYLFSDVSPEILAISNKTSSIALKDHMDFIINDRVSWCVIAYPSIKWAKRVFPELNDNEAVDKLLEYILKAARADGANPISDWSDHVNELSERADYLNEQEIVSLHYKSSTADLTIELPDSHIWISGKSLNHKNDVEFSANIPTEEVFTVPKKNGVNGWIKSTMPLNYNGNLIEDFSFKFVNGKITEANASKGLSILKNAITMDEGASFLGEVALVPYDSPISNLKTLFYNTLFDENASCHFAFGACYPTNLKDSEAMSKEEIESCGGNISITHVDFMVGSSDLDIVATKKDGSTFNVFKSGNWAF